MCQYWSNEGIHAYGEFLVEVLSQDESDGYIRRNIKIIKEVGIDTHLDIHASRFNLTGGAGCALCCSDSGDSVAPKWSGQQSWCGDCSDGLCPVSMPQKGKRTLGHSLQVT